jgi:phosphocarrier protein HPr
VPQREMTIVNKLGLHARAAARFVDAASRYQARIEVQTPRRTVNGKSIMGLMMLAAARGTIITVQADGDDAEQALEALETLVMQRFGERE